MRKPSKKTLLFVGTFILGAIALLNTQSPKDSNEPIDIGFFTQNNFLKPFVPKYYKKPSPDQIPSSTTQLSNNPVPGRNIASESVADDGQARREARQTVIDHFKIMARYPDHSMPIFAGNDTILNNDRVIKSEAKSAQNGASPFTLTVTTSKSFYQFPESPIIYAEVKDSTNKTIAGKFSAKLLFDVNQEIGTFELNDLGQGVDQVAGDGIYSGSPDFGSKPNRNYIGNHTVVVQASHLAGNTEIRTTTGYGWADVGGKLTGRFKDSSDGKYLTLQSEIQVSTPGTYYMQASLYTKEGKALAWADYAMELKPGTHWFPLKFYGLILNEQKEDGPYTVRSIFLARTQIVPMMKGPLLENAHHTAPYKASQFTSQPFQNPNYTQQISDLEKDNELGI